jgi:Trypsin-co-occurring domain 1
MRDVMPDETTKVRVFTPKPEKEGSAAQFAIEVAAIGETRVSTAQQYDFDDFAGSLEALAGSLRTAIGKIAPKKAVLEFGVEVGVESGKLTALLVKGSGKANLKVTLEWS